ncbi:hypothetical protein [Pseudomonas sp. TSRC2-2]|uniref:hypothetical protein n=1 Tax=Pseudomonas sp. TSRC2-2 TaxID=2804571 RepID=UPI003CEFF085
MSQPLDTALPFTNTPTTPEALYKKLGVYCVAWEQMVLNAMTYLLGGEYQGGSYEIREYLNGAFAMIIPDQAAKKVAKYGHREESMTLEAASFVANLMAFSACNSTAIDTEDEAGNLMLHDFYFALKDVVSGRYGFIIDASADDGTRPLNENELATIQSEAKPHPERIAILRMID